MRRFFCALALLVACVRPAAAEDVTIAVASNFLSTAERLVEVFEAASGHDATIAHGSTGQIYAQIVSGAPFDVFLAADAQRPALLRQDGLAEMTRTYALGKLVLVSRIPVTEDSISEAFAGQNVALADPIVAPYGLASTSAMERLRLDTATFQPILVANVAQVATVFATGNADFAFIAEALLPRLAADHVLPLAGKHPPIRQDAALLVRAADNPAAMAFWTFLETEEARSIIGAAGYDLPE
ncbi:MAG: molybdate ABC transporter substrate-binding protein [Paracoccaceae bacterium]|nr:molybdate ABC transporter substrate-binding protein [Paracoccaceae bacterium]